MCMSYLRLYPEVRDITGLLLAKLPRDAGSVIEFINIFLLHTGISEQSEDVYIKWTDRVEIEYCGDLLQSHKLLSNVAEDRL